MSDKYKNGKIYTFRYKNDAYIYYIDIVKQYCLNI